MIRRTRRTASGFYFADEEAATLWICVRWMPGKALDA